MVEIAKFIMQNLNYNLKNIRELLLDTFTTEELQRLCEINSDFQAVSRALPQDASQNRIVQELLGYAERRLKLETLLALVKEKSPANYEAHRPYYASVTVSANITAKGSDQEVNRLKDQFSQATLQQKISDSLALLVQNLKFYEELLYQAEQKTRIVELLNKEKGAEISFSITITGEETCLKDLSARLSQESIRQQLSDNLEPVAQALKEASEEPPKASSIFSKLGNLLGGK